MQHPKWGWCSPISQGAHPNRAPPVLPRAELYLYIFFSLQPVHFFLLFGCRPCSDFPPRPHLADRLLADRHLHGQRRLPPARRGPVLDPERPAPARRLLRRPRPHHAQRGPRPPQRLQAAVGGQPGVPQPGRWHPGRILPLCRTYVGAAAGCAAPRGALPRGRAGSSSAPLETFQRDEFDKKNKKIKIFLATAHQSRCLPPPVCPSLRFHLSALSGLCRSLPDPLRLGRARSRKAALATLGEITVVRINNHKILSRAILRMILRPKNTEA